jgi:hypothetical protein
MMKHSAKKQAVEWTRSAINKLDLTKAKKLDVLLSTTEVIFPSDEIIPDPSRGFQVMFLSFLFRGMSLIAHKFLYGLHFVYGVQLHQLMPNSTLLVSSLCVKLSSVLIRIGDCGNKYSTCTAMHPRRTCTMLAAPLFLCMQKRSTSSSKWPNLSKIGERNGSTSRTKNPPRGSSLA